MADYIVSQLPNIKDKRITMYKRETKYGPDGNVVETGEIVAMPNLPADGETVLKYMRRGFALKPEDLMEVKQEIKCEVCDKSFKNALGLTGHMRTHNKK